MFCFTHSLSVSLHEGLIAAMVFMVLTSFLWKWPKVFLLIIKMEMLSVLVLVNIFVSGLFSSMILYLLTFFVCEALVMLSALFNQMRELGSIYSTVSLW